MTPEDQLKSIIRSTSARRRGPRTRRTCFQVAPRRDLETPAPQRCRALDANHCRLVVAGPPPNARRGDVAAAGPFHVTLPPVEVPELCLKASGVRPSRRRTRVSCFVVTDAKWPSGIRAVVLSGRPADPDREATRSNRACAASTQTSTRSAAGRRDCVPRVFPCPRIWPRIWPGAALGPGRNRRCQRSPAGRGPTSGRNRSRGAGQGSEPVASRQTRNNLGCESMPIQLQQA